MKCWLVVDLRDNRFATALLDLDAKKARWVVQPITVYPHPSLYNNVAETDLSFFKRINEKIWYPTVQEFTKNPPEGYEVIPALFDEDLDQLSKIFSRVLNSLLYDVLRDHPKVPLLFIVDCIEAKALIHEYSKLIDRDCKVFITPRIPGEFEGFALLELEKVELPQEKSIFTCSISSNGGKEEIRSYQWQQNYFSRVEVIKPPRKPITRWESAAQLQRAGLATLFLVWQTQLIPNVGLRIKEITKENEELSLLLRNMKKLLKNIRKLTVVNT